MAAGPETTKILRGTPEAAAMVAELRRAAAIVSRINGLGLDDGPEIRSLLAELIGRPVGESVRLFPPFFATGGTNTRLGERVFINQNCTFYDLGGIDIGDDVLIGPNVSLITSGHPLDPAQRHSGVTAKAIAIGRNVWIGAGATVIGGVTIGANSVIAAGSVVTRDVAPDVLAGGNPATVIRSLD